MGSDYKTSDRPSELLERAIPYGIATLHALF